MPQFDATEQAAYARAVTAVQAAGVASSTVIQQADPTVSENLAVNLLDQMRFDGLIGDVLEDGSHALLS